MHAQLSHAQAPPRIPSAGRGLVSRLSSSLRRASASGFSPGALPALPQSPSAPAAPPSLAPLRLKTRSTSREEGAFASILDRQGSSSRPISPPAQGGCLKAPCALQTVSIHPACGALCMEVTGLWDPSAIDVLEDLESINSDKCGSDVACTGMAPYPPSMSQYPGSPAASRRAASAPDSQSLQQQALANPWSHAFAAEGSDVASPAPGSARGPVDAQQVGLSQGH